MMVISLVLAAMIGAGSAEPKAKQQAPTNQTLPEAEVRTRVLAYLSTIDTPIPAAEWQALGPRAAVVLREIVGNEENLPTRRAKAIDGLSFVSGAAAADVFRASALSDSEPLVVRYAALRGLGHVTGEQALTAELSPILGGAKDLRVRAYAGEMLVRRNGADRCAILRSHVANEAADHQRYFARALALCQGE